MWFEHMGVFSEPIFNFSFVRLTLKQVGTLFGGLLFAYAIASGINQFAGAAAACLALLITFYRPQVMPLELYVLAAVRFLVAKKQRVAEKKRVAALMGKNLEKQNRPSTGDEIDGIVVAGKGAYPAKTKANGILSFSFRKKKMSE